MSEQIKFDTNNLYITEEAFENFQANSMYEESEYITLSDIVPPHPQPNLICTIDEVPCENEIVSSSILDYPTLDVNNVPHSSTDGDIVPKIVSESVECLEYETNTPNDYDNSDNHIIQEPENTHISGSQEITNLQPNKRAKRGRKKNLKYSNITNSVDGNINFNVNKSIINNDSLGNVISGMCRQGVNTVTNNIQKRRGRKSKKMQNKVNTSLQNQSTIESFESSQSNVVNDISHENTTSETYDRNIKYVQKRRGRKSKKLQNQTNEHVGVRATNESNPSSYNNAINDVSHEKIISKGHYNQGEQSITVTNQKKRGRRRKIQNETDKNLQIQTINENVPLSQNNTINDISKSISEAQEPKMNAAISSKRRNRKKKVSHVELATNNLTSPTENLTKTLTTLKDNINTSMSLAPSATELQNCQLSSNETKTISRKGKKHKKILVSEQETVTNNNVKQYCKNKKENQYNSSDEDDDISLNKLKWTLDVKGDEEKDNTEIVDMEIEMDNIANVTVVDNNNEMPSVSIDQDIIFEQNKEESEMNHSALTNVTPSKRSSKMSMMSDFEYNIDKVVNETLEDNMDYLKTKNNENDSLDNTPLTMDLSKRPSRRKTKQTLHYEEDSDEDPFANVELSDEEPRRNRKKGYRYDSDDEYIPGKKIGKGDRLSDSSDSTLNEALGDIKKKARKRTRKRLDTGSQSKSLRKKSKKYDTESSVSSIGHTLDVTTIPPDSSYQINDDIEICLESSVIKINDDASPKLTTKAWGAINEFENFIAKKIQGTNLKIKKVSSTGPSDSIIAPLEIPVINPEMKKCVEMCTQTVIQTTSSSVQTTTPHSVPMKENVKLTKQQAENACEFLKSIVNTTAELGQLMTQKSEDFITKKINTLHVTDTFKMDYCVQKSFLLFKLAKHNLMQMEQDLAKQYEEFLDKNNLSTYREKQKDIEPKIRKTENSDSDCEIVETPTQTKEKPKFNPKTVFLNKELSIKIAKKSTEDSKQKDTNKLNIKGRRTVWINDSVMVKKVKPNQSFLAQDSRNKKPPDNLITENMVSDFFKNYYPTKMLSTCSSFTSKEWLHIEQNYICNYFFVKSTRSMSNGEQLSTNNTENRDNTRDIKQAVIQNNEIVQPQTLFSLCTMVLQQKMYNDSKKPFHDYTQLSDLKNLNPKTLFQLCLNIAMPKLRQNCTSNSMDITEDEILRPLTLKALSYQRIVQLMSVNAVCKDNTKNSSMDIINHKEHNFTCSNNNTYKDASNVSITAVKSNGMKSLFSLCVELIQHKQNMFIVKDFIENKYHTSSRSQLDSSYMENRREIQHMSTNNSNTYNVNSLKHIVFNNVKELMYKQLRYESQSLTVLVNSAFGRKVKKLADICFDIISMHFNDDDIGPNVKEVDTTASLTIDNVNTVSEEVFHNMEENSVDYQENSYAEDEQTIHYDEDEFEPAFEDEQQTEDNSWVSQVQMKEFRSCVSPCTPTDSERQCVEEAIAIANIESFTAHIKIEPEEAAENVINPIIIKSEPMNNLDEMTVIPENVITKIESTEAELPSRDSIQRQNSACYDESIFEAFVRSNKMLNMVNEATDNYDKSIFSQSALRVRRQHEPDSDNENDSNMSLLVPQTFEPLRIDTAKGSLMQSSDDEDNVNKNKKNTEKKTKRKSRPKKSDMKGSDKDMSTTTKEKSQKNSEVAMLTRRMREKIRQEEKKNDSSDSETEKISMILKKENNEKKRFLRSNKIDYEIQCNSVDSTQQVFENTNIKSSLGKDTENSTFTGFSAVDQNEVSNYEKYVKFVYNKIIPDGESENCKDIQNVSQNNLESKENCSGGVNTECHPPLSPVINPEEPVELLECEPTMPIFDDISNSKPSKKKSVVNQAKIKENDTKKSELKQLETSTLPYIERHGWKCYPIDANDPKLYQIVRVVVEKLPISFIETYFEYQNIVEKSKDDIEVDRLTNLQTLNKISNTKEPKNKLKNKAIIEQMKLGQASTNSSRVPSPTNTDHFNELTPSEDEGTNIEDKLPPTARQTTENNLAKSSLMNDNDSDVLDDTSIKQEFQEDNVPKKTLRAGPKSKTKVDVKTEPTDSLMLTADKMMNKELTLLHAPIVLDVKVPDIPVKGQNTKNKHNHNLRSHTNKDRQKSDDSSSEEEKQWVNTKEKLLKRMVKRQENTSMDDAKHAKLVNEFIERRSEVKRKKLIGRKRRSRKHLLEQEKQLRVLSNELYGEGSTHISKKYSQAYFKGRRNIRKVLDKKSLARSTVVANMEEFERKRRLIARQNKLRELLGYEEGVNVLVINDEVCLEYDFEVNRPVVTVHPFFTKVMKAHQYEGVKFMWDTCFESLEYVEAGHPGSGCILAHCMGLGKTLQVLALLHTVLTHPRVGMHRVLVCCPLSTVLNWVDEIHKWIGPVTTQIKVFELSKLKKTYERAYQLEDWYNGGGIFIIGYELFRSLTTLDPELDDVRPTIINKIRTALLDPGPDIIVCDEGHLLKNDCSVLAVAMSRVATRRRIVLTGTPMQNNLREYYCMVNFIKPNLLGTYSEYSNRFENPIMNGQHRDSREEDIRLMKARTHILHKVLEGCLQRQEASVLYPYLPKKYEYTVFITLSNCQSELYKHYMQHYAKKNKQSLLKDFHVLQKIWSHPQVLHNFQMRREESLNKVKAEKLEDDLANEELSVLEMKPSDTEIWWLQYLDGGGMLDTLDSSNKFVTVFQILDECVQLGDKVLIFSTSLFTMDALEYFLRTRNNWGLGQEYYRLDGSVPAEVRQKWCREFNAEHNLKTKLFLISTRAGSLGLNMTAANRVIILDTSWNPAHDIQSIFRVYRFGQKKDCYIYRLVAMGTMEQKIYERSVTKQAVACRVVDEQQIDRHYNSAELTELYSFDESGCSVAGGVAAGVTDVVLLRVARDSGLHAVHEHDSLLRGSAEQGLPEHERAAAWMQFQQEHAHNQMQNELLANVQMKLSLKKSSGQDDAKASTSKETPEIKSEYDDRDTDYQPVDPKIKKGKKEIVVRHYIPIQPSNQQPNEESIQAQSLDLDQEKQDNIVKKITDILIRHNFQNRNGHKQISDLVQNVREIVTMKKITNLPITDGLAESIAKVFLHKEKKSNVEITSSIDVNLSSNEIHLDAARKRGRPVKRSRTLAHDEYVPPMPLDVAPELSEDFEHRVQRKAALAAKKHLDTIVNDSVEDIDDSGWQINSDTDSIPESDLMSYDKDTHLLKQDINTASGNSNKKKLAPKTIGRQRKIIVSRKIRGNSAKKKQSNSDTVANIQTKDSIEENEEPITSEMESILLSDDDDEPIQKSNSPKKKMKPSPTPVSIERPDDRSKVVEVIDSDDNEVVPLDPYILTNENFVKVVAHTYLTGNPMLDEDAALLAAQYSTQKTIKEMQEAGKNEITSGPIYDIAVKVLGKDVLSNFQKSYSQSKAAKGSMSAQQVAQQQNTAIMESNSLLDEVQKTQSNISHIPVKKSLTKVVLKPSVQPASVVFAASDDTPSATAPQPQLTPAIQPLDLSTSQFRPTIAPQPSIQTAPIPRFKIISKQRPVIAQNLRLATAPLSHLITTPQPRLVNSTETQAPVVPVGFFKRSENLTTDQSFTQSVDEECILPDDDDVHIISDAFSSTPGIDAAASPAFTALSSPPISSSSIVAVSSAGQTLVHTSTSGFTPSSSANTNLARRNSRPLVLTNVTAKAASSTHSTKNNNENITSHYVPLAPHPFQTKSFPILTSQSQKMPMLRIESGNVIMSPNQSTVGSGTDNVHQHTSVPTNTPELICLDSEIELSPKESAAMMGISTGTKSVRQQMNVSAMTSESTDTICLDSDDELELNNPQRSLVHKVAPAVQTAVPVMLTSSITNSQAVPVSLMVNPIGFASNSTMARDEFILSPSSMPVSQIDVDSNHTNVSKSMPVLPDTQNKATTPLNRTETDPVNNDATSTPRPNQQTRVYKRLTRVEHPMFAAQTKTGTAKRIEIKNPDQTTDTMKALCKPGDIIRITKTGVEILNIATDNDNVSIAESTKTALSSQSNTNQTSGEKALAPEETAQPCSRTRTVSVSSSDSSNSSRAPSPDLSEDPLSILKNVVHIQAHVYDDSTFKKRQHTGSSNNIHSDNLGDYKEGRDRSRVKMSEKQARSATSSSATKNTANKNSTDRHLDLSKSTIVINDDYPLIHPKSNTSKNFPLTLEKVSSVSKNVLSISKNNTPSASKNPPSTSKSTSTTSTASTHKTYLRDQSSGSSLPKRVNSKQSFATVVGTSKNIIISGVGKPTISNSPTPTSSALNNAASRIIRVTNMTTIPPNKTPQKRPSEQNATNTAKKKKTTEPMSLKDFDIDDIDDIIELE